RCAYSAANRGVALASPAGSPFRPWHGSALPPRSALRSASVPPSWPHCWSFRHSTSAERCPSRPAMWAWRAARWRFRYALTALALPPRTSRASGRSAGIASAQCFRASAPRRSCSLQLGSEFADPGPGRMQCVREPAPLDPELLQLLVERLQPARLKVDRLGEFGDDRL